MADERDVMAYLELANNLAELKRRMEECWSKLEYENRVGLVCPDDFLESLKN